MGDEQILGFVAEAETALRGIRGVLRTKREEPKDIERELVRMHHNEKARIAHRLSLLGVTHDILAQAFGMSPANAAKLAKKGELLNHKGLLRKDMLEMTDTGETLLWESGLLSLRCARVLRYADIDTVNDLCRRTLQDLASIPGLGTAYIREIETLLSELGRRLKE